MNDMNIPGQLSPGSSVRTDESLDPDILFYVKVVDTNKYKILGLVGFISVVAYFFTLLMTPVYRSTATLLIEANEANVVSIEQVYGLGAGGSEYYKTQFEILNSRRLAEDVVSKLALDTVEEFYEARSIYRQLRNLIEKPQELTTDLKKLRALSYFRENLTIEPMLGTQLVEISFDSQDPELAARIANALGDAYIDNYLESKFDLTQKAADWLTGRLSGLRGNLEGSERRLQEFLKRENLVDVQGVNTLTARELDELTRKLVGARKVTAEAKNLLDQVGGRVESRFDPAWERIQFVTSDPLVRELKKEQVKASQNLVNLSQRYGPKHPKLLAAKSILDTATSNYQSRVLVVIRSLGNNYQNAQSEEQSFEQELNRAKGNIQRIGDKTYQLSELRREVEANQQLYNLFFTRFKETDQAAFESANARFVDRAVRRGSPVKPRTTLIVAIAGVLAGLVGVVLSFLVAGLSNTFRSDADVEARLGISVLGMVPLIDKKLIKEELQISAFNDKKLHGFSEAVRTVRTGIVLGSVEQSIKIMAVTSSVPGEGKTTLSTNLALAFGQMERVLLVDADMRRPSVAKVTGLPLNSKGLSDVVAGLATLDESIVELKEFGIDVLPAGTIPPNPLELLSAAAFKNLLLELGERYDRVIVDTAPTQAVSDSLVLSRLVETMIYVIRADETNVDVVRSGLKRLKQVDAPLLGVVLNRFDAKSASRYGYRAKGYYDYYGYGYSSQGYGNDS
tara:strand:+ start:97786 stop:99996 length:2211 start_codon:yes stop_codon:yes gene_type:complete